jgi:hypothetical protein
MVTKYRGRVGGQSRFLILWCQQTRALPSVYYVHYKTRKFTLLLTEE